MKEDLLLNQKQGTSSKRVAPDQVRDMVCGLFGMYNSTYITIVTKYFTDRSVYSSGELGLGRCGNQSSKMTRLPHTKELVVRVMEL